MGAKNHFRNMGPFHDESARQGETITPDDDNDLANVTRAFRVGVAGDVKVTYLGGNVAVIPAVQLGETVAVQVTRIWATGTTADVIHVQW